MRQSAEFQRRIDDAIEDGWQIEEESPGRVVLRKPDYGDLAIHILLFVFTAGLGNIIYGAHCYINHPQRKVLREDDLETEDGTNFQSEAADKELETLDIDAELEAIRAETGGGDGQTTARESSPESSLEALKLQYARGEIDDDEFERAVEQHTGERLSETGNRPSRLRDYKRGERDYEHSDTVQARERAETEREVE